MVDAGAVDLVLEEDETMAVRGYLKAEFKEGVGEQEPIPSLANRTGSEEGGWWKKCDHAIDQALRKLAPYSSVHPWTAAR